ncbi:MAG: MraY family glycosyltransferase, partial [Acidimicrobiales bacterium]
FAAAGIAIAAGLRVELIGNDALGVAIALVWLVGITNAFNLLDNMDGLAATLATIACVYFAIDAATVHENDLVLVLALSLAFACLGFLPFNVRPGRPAAIFMGDSGSQVLGFALAALGLYASWNVAGTTVATLLLPILVLGVPILDTAFAVFRRTVRRRSFAVADKDHLHHRLMRLGHGQRRSVLILWAWTAILSGLVLYPVYTDQGNGLVPFGVAALGVVLYTVLHPQVRRRRVDRAEQLQLDLSETRSGHPS